MSDDTMSEVIYFLCKLLWQMTNECHVVSLSVFTKNVHLNLFSHVPRAIQIIPAKIKNNDNPIKNCDFNNVISLK